MALTHAANPQGLPEVDYFKKPVFTFTEAFLVTVTQIPMVYIMLYFVLPRPIFKRRYVSALLTIFLLWLLFGAMNIYLITDRMPGWLSAILPEQYVAETRLGAVSFYMPGMATNKEAFPMAAMALMLKFVEYWYMKDHRNLQLQKENTEAQMQLLTARVHPHFLFNTLNNVYSQTQPESPRGSRMITGLSDMLRYILYEGNKRVVPLDYVVGKHVYQDISFLYYFIEQNKILYPGHCGDR
jgi:hypothetical protein